MIGFWIFTWKNNLGWLIFYRLGWVEFYRYHQLADKVITKIRPFINVNAKYFINFGLLLVNAYFIAKWYNKYLVVHNFCNCWLYRITSFVCICIYIVFVVSCIRWHIMSHFVFKRFWTPIWYCVKILFRQNSNFWHSVNYVMVINDVFVERAPGIKDCHCKVTR